MKHLPVSFFGELHDVQLINFSIEWNEIKYLVPEGITPLFTEPDRVLISTVNVDLRHMRPFSHKIPVGFRYRHVAFRLLVDDRYSCNEPSKGIYFLRGFTNNRIIAAGASMVKSFHLSYAEINHNSKRTRFELKQGKKYLRYEIDPGKFREHPKSLYNRISSINSAYNIDENRAYKIRICREQWPILGIETVEFETNFFKTARLEGSYLVPQTIYYQWEKPVSANLMKVEMETL